MAKETYVTLYTDKNHAAVSYEGETFDVVDGKVEVPEKAAAIFLESFGFTTHPKVAIESKEPSFETMTNKDLIAALTEAEVEFDPKAKRPELLKLANEFLELETVK